MPNNKEENEDEEKESEIAKYAVQGAPKSSDEKKLTPEQEKQLGLIQTIIIIILIIAFAAILYYLLTNYFEIQLPF